MATFKHLLVTTDFSQAAQAGIRAGRDLAAQLGARISLVHVCEEILPPLTFSTPAQRAEIHRQSLHASQKQLAACAREFFRNIPAETHLRHGRPSEEIAECAKEVGADLIVSASQGRGSVGQLIFGSTAQRIIQSAPCPVVVVKAEPEP